MSLINKAKFALTDPKIRIEKLIKEWSLENCMNEKDYENSLFEYLQSSLQGIEIKKQYAQGRTKVDLMIGDVVIVELKHDFSTTAKFQRLIGQINEYNKWGRELLIVLTGKTDPDLVEELRKEMAKDLIFASGDRSVQIKNCK